MLWTQRKSHVQPVGAVGLGAQPDINQRTLSTFRRLAITLRRLGTPERNVKRIAWAAALMQDGWDEPRAWADTDRHFPMEET